jgi:hypothetical protein
MIEYLLPELFQKSNHVLDECGSFYVGATCLLLLLVFLPSGRELSQAAMLVPNRSVVKAHLDLTIFLTADLVLVILKDSHLDVLVRDFPLRITFGMRSETTKTYNV